MAIVLLAFGIPMLGVMAAIAIPAFMKYTRRAKTSEATMNIRKMFDSSVSYFEREHASRLGVIHPRQFPDSAALSPGEHFCGADSIGDKWVPKKTYWVDPTWQALNFALSDPHYYSYQYVSRGTNTASMFTTRAVGDLNCNGVLSTFERVAIVDQSLNVLGGGGVYTENELE